MIFWSLKMKNAFELKATKRSDVGKGASRRLRHAGKVPGIVYGARKEAEKVVLDHKNLFRSLENEAFYSRILTLDLDGRKEQVVLKDLQRHPYRDLITHIDLLRVSATEKITMQVPLHFLGQDMAPGFKKDGGIFSHLMSEVTVRCLPADLPEYFDIDVSQMELNAILHLSDIKLPKGVELVDLTHGEDKAIVTVYIPKAQPEPTEEVPGVAAGEVPASEVTKTPEGEGEVKEGKGKEGKEGGKEAKEAKPQAKEGKEKEKK
jgi:large subunit ribosomal protein L25